MGEDYYAVYFGEVKLADNMTLGTALLFIKAYLNEYYDDDIHLTIRKVAKERRL